MRPFQPVLEIRHTPIGQAVFALAAIPAFEAILEFRGAVHAARDLTDPYLIDHSIQIGPDTYLGPTGGGSADDYVNHACDPNCGVIVTVENVLLVAIRRIEAGEEVTYDYSTTMWRNPWPMVGCRCGAASCRGTIGDYAELPAHVRNRYERYGVVPAYARRGTARPVAPDRQEAR
jgi:hypothetical protein